MKSVELTEKSRVLDEAPWRLKYVLLNVHLITSLFKISPSFIPTSQNLKQRQPGLKWTHIFGVSLEASCASHSYSACEQVTCQILSLWNQPLFGLSLIYECFHTDSEIWAFIFQRASQKTVPKRHRKFCSYSSSFLALNSQRTPLMLHQLAADIKMVPEYLEIKHLPRSSKYQKYNKQFTIYTLYLWIKRLKVFKWGLTWLLSVVFSAFCQQLL